MKERICNSRFIRWFAALAPCRWLSGNRFFGKFCNYEFISYVICGALTTLVNYGAYFIARLVFTGDTGVIISNVIAWTVAVIFAFFVNKIFVFDSPSWDFKTFIREFVPFIVCGLLWLGLDTGFVYLSVGVLHWNEPLFKLLSNVFVLIANYFASKLIVFKKRNAEESEIAENTESR